MVSKRTTHRERIARYADLSSALALHSDRQLMRLVDGACHLGSGIGGTTCTLELNGAKVFAKRLRLTDLERRPEHQLSTANLFHLPTFYQRNVGSVGFGAWRELAANVMTTGWVLSQQLACFPLMYHWRVLEGAASPGAVPLPVELTDVDGMVSYWGNSEAVRMRLEALARATASVMIFLEYLPWNLLTWLNEQVAAGPAELDSACTMVERCLTRDIARMNALGLLHGDAHAANIVTDGHRLYVADLGLALSKRFALSNDELRFLQDNANLDRAYAVANWVNWLVKASCPEGTPLQHRMDLIRAVAQGQPLHLLIPDMTPTAAAIVRRHAPVATVTNDFYFKLHGERRTTPYPRDDIDTLLRAAPS